MSEGILEKLKSAFSLGEDDYEEEGEVVPEVRASGSRSQAAAVNANRNFTYPERNYSQPRAEMRESKVVSMQNSTHSVRQHFKLVLTEPSSFDECPKLVDGLKSKKPVIINLANLDNETAHKIFNFLSGATYALNGNVQKIANNIFVFAPEDVDLLSGTEEEKKSSLSMSGSLWRR